MIAINCSIQAVELAFKGEVSQKNNAEERVLEAEDTFYLSPGCRVHPSDSEECDSRAGELHITPVFILKNSIVQED